MLAAATDAEREEGPTPAEAEKASVAGSTAGLGEVNSDPTPTATAEKQTAASTGPENHDAAAADGSVATDGSPSKKRNLETEAAAASDAKKPRTDAHGEGLYSHKQYE